MVGCVTGIEKCGHIKCSFINVKKFSQVTVFHVQNILKTLFQFLITYVSVFTKNIPRV